MRLNDQPRDDVGSYAPPSSHPHDAGPPVALHGVTADDELIDLLASGRIDDPRLVDDGADGELVALFMAWHRDLDRSGNPGD